MFAAFTKKENDSVYYIKDAKVTTGGSLENRTITLELGREKWCHKEKLLRVSPICILLTSPPPLPCLLLISLPHKNNFLVFCFPPSAKAINRGYSVQNGGYYLALSQYYDVALTGDYFSNGSYGFRLDSKYRLMYNFSGSLSMRFENLISGERGIPDYSKSTVFNVRWNHAKDPKATPNSNFSASVNFGSSDYFRESVNQLNSPNFLNNTLSSSIAYTKRIPGNPSVNLSFNANMSQNSNTKNVNPNPAHFSRKCGPHIPLNPRTDQKGILQNINLQYSTRAENRIITSEDDLLPVRCMTMQNRAYNTPSL